MRLLTSLRNVLPVAMAMLGGCQAAAPVAAAPEPVPINGVGYLVFSAPINPNSRDLFIADMEKLRLAGATEIHIAMNSPGGDIDAAQGMVDYLERTHGQNGVTYKAYNVGLVASAATYVFLNTQARYSAPNGAFLFHAAAVTGPGMNAQTLRDSADKLDAYERTVRASMKAHTRLSDAETQTYVRRTVVLNSDDARRDGVVDAISPFVVPQGARTWIIVNKPTTPATRPTAPAPAPG